MLSGKLAQSVTQEYIFGVQEKAGISAVDKYDNVSSILGAVFNLAMGIGIGIAIFSAGYACIIFIMSRGNPTEFSKATQAFIWALAGMAIVIGAWAFKAIVLNALGVTDGQFMEAPSGF